MTLSEDASLTVTDTADPMIAGPNYTIRVRGDAVAYSVTIGGPVIQYADFTVTVTALDINGNAAVGYTGTFKCHKGYLFYR